MIEASTEKKMFKSNIPGHNASIGIFWGAVERWVVTELIGLYFSVHQIQNGKN